MTMQASSFLQKALRPVKGLISKIQSLFQTHIWLRRVTISLIAIVALVIVYKVLASIFGWGGPQYRTVALEEGPLAVTISASGTLNPVKSVQVGTQVSGMVQEIYVDFNDVVKKSQVIARIDPREWQARFEQAEANYILAKRNHDNNKRLIEKNFISPAAFDQTLSVYKSAKASLSMAKKALDDTVIRSPVDGVVVKRSVERGQTVAASLQAPELFIIAQDLADMQVETAIDESDVGRITEGMTATFTVDAFPGKVFQSKVKQVRKAPINVQNVITYTVLLSAQNTDLKLLPGMTANTSIITEQKEKVLRISNAALRFKMPNTESTAEFKSGSRPASAGTAGAGPAGAGSAKSAGAKPMGAGPRVMVRKVWVLDQSGLKDKPVQKTVRLGLSDGNASEVLPAENGETELKPGDLVITGITGASKPSAARPAGPRLF
jgi:HlyD family secretion protein